MVKDGFKAPLVLIGFPYDEGALKSGHRSGANLGPDSFRRFLPSLGPVDNPEYGISLTPLQEISDYGNIMPPPGFPTIERSYQKLQTKCALLAGRG